MQAALIKARVVVADPKERGVRAILNFGHTIGHAVEAYMQPSLLHGECVAIGMLAEARLARSLGYLGLDSSAIRRLEALCRSFHLPVDMPPVHVVTVPQLLARMAVDKKNAGSKVRMNMITGACAATARPVMAVSLLTDW